MNIMMHSSGYIKSKFFLAAIILINTTWDIYIYTPNSVKNSQEKNDRKILHRNQMSGPTKLISDSRDFLLHFKKKRRAFNFLTNKLCRYDYPNEKSLCHFRSKKRKKYIMSVMIMIVISTIVSQTTICTSLCQPMSPCDHEENTPQFVFIFKMSWKRVIGKFL